MGRVMSRASFLLAMCSLCLSLTCASSDGPVQVRAWRAVEFTHRGYFCQEPCDFSLRVRVEPRPENQALAVVCVSEGMERGSLTELNEKSAATQDPFKFVGLMAGDYVCRATVYRADGSTRIDETRIKVLGFMP
jgi:hypothetical protein